jgi:hypothetical protein
MEKGTVLYDVKKDAGSVGRRLVVGLTTNFTELYEL